MKTYDRVQLKTLTDIKDAVNDNYNPVGAYGTILTTKGKYYPIVVLWDNGIRNSYNLKNLEKL